MCFKIYIDTPNSNDRGATNVILNINSYNLKVCIQK